MRISVDLDGTLYAHKAFFRELFRAFRLAGHEVGILTGHSAESEADDRAVLTADGFVIDFYFGRTPSYIPFNGMRFKLHVLETYGVDLHFDDLDYGNSGTVRLLQEAPLELQRRVVIMPHKGEGVKSE